jgi:hypothetical protein
MGVYQVETNTCVETIQTPITRSRREVVTIYKQPPASPHPRCLFAINPRPPNPLWHPLSLDTDDASVRQRKPAPVVHRRSPPPPARPWSPLSSARPWSPPSSARYWSPPPPTAPWSLDGEHPVLPRDAPPKGWEGSASVSAHSSSSAAPCSLEKKRDLQERCHGV